MLHDCLKDTMCDKQSSYDVLCVCVEPSLDEVVCVCVPQSFHDVVSECVLNRRLMTAGVCVCVKLLFDVVC